MEGKKIVVPEGMLKAAREAGRLTSWDSYSMLAAALLWLSENPIVPTGLVESDMYSEWKKGHDLLYPMWVLREWQRRMFLTPEPEVPEEIKDLVEGMSWNTTTPKAIIEAFRRGQKSKG